MTTYFYEDIPRLILPKKHLIKFLEKASKVVGGIYLHSEAFNRSAAHYEDRMKWTLETLLAADYRNRPEYVLAETSRDRALAAMKGATNKAKHNILGLWMEVVNQMSTFEKVMAGWDKV